MSIVEIQGSDKNILKNLHKKVEEKMVTAEDYMYLAETVSRRFADSVWSAELYKKARKASELQKVKFKLMGSVQQTLGNRNLLSRFFKA